MTVKKIADTMTPSLKKIRLAFEEIPEEAYRYWVSVTPKRTGNARKRTKLRKNMIVADYPYAVPLDEGASRQAPKGMSDPTIKHIKSLADQAIRK